MPCPVGTIVLASALAIVAVGVFNNLPATLVTLPHITRTATVWPLLFGLNAGPALVITGSLAGLLWQASARASGVHVSARRYSAVGAIVGVPSMIAGMIVLRLR